MSATVPRKRKLDEVTETPIDSPQEQKKKQLSPQPTFLQCHLKMLRALYVDIGHSSSCETLSDGAVSEEVWEMIGKFLKERQELRKLKLQALRSRKAVDESKKSLDKQRSDSPEKSIMSSVSPWQLNDHSSSVKRRLFVTPLPIKGKTMSRTIEAGSSLILVAKLLERRACVAENNLRKLVRPFHDLYEAVCMRSERLESSLQRVESQDREILDETQEEVCGIDAKNKLWKMLANDLYNVIDI